MLACHREPIYAQERAYIYTIAQTSVMRGWAFILIDVYHLYFRIVHWTGVCKKSPTFICDAKNVLHIRETVHSPRCLIIHTYIYRDSHISGSPLNAHTYSSKPQTRPYHSPRTHKQPSFHVYWEFAECAIYHFTPHPPRFNPGLAIAVYSKSITLRLGRSVLSAQVACSTPNVDARCVWRSARFAQQSFAITVLSLVRNWRRLWCAQ